MRTPLPNRRETTRQRITIGGHRLFVDVGVYPDGKPGEVFISIEKTGSDLRSTMDTVARLISLSLQWGIPLESIIHLLQDTRFAPSGIVAGDKRIKFASSPLDYVARYLGVYYGGLDELAHVKQKEVL